jgi:hypothetical protein
MSELRKAANLLCPGFDQTMLDEAFDNPESQIRVKRDDKNNIIAFAIFRVEMNDNKSYLDLICSKPGQGETFLKLVERDMYEFSNVIELQSVDDARVFYISQGYQFVYRFEPHEMLMFESLQEHIHNTKLRFRVRDILDNHDMMRTEFDAKDNMCMLAPNTYGSLSNNVKNINVSIYHKQSKILTFPGFKNSSEMGIRFLWFIGDSYIVVNQKTSNIQQCTQMYGKHIIELVQHVSFITHKNNQEFRINVLDNMRHIWIREGFVFKIPLANTMNILEYDSLKIKHDQVDYMTMFKNIEDQKQIQEHTWPDKSRPTALDALQELNKMRSEFDVVVSTELITCLKRRYIDMWYQRHYLLALRKLFGRELLSDVEDAMNEWDESISHEDETKHELADLLVACNDLHSMLICDRQNIPSIVFDAVYQDTVNQLTRVLIRCKQCLQSDPWFGPMEMPKDLRSLTSLVTQSFYYDFAMDTNYHFKVLSHCEKILKKTKLQNANMGYLCTHIIFAFTRFGFMPRFEWEPKPLIIELCVNILMKMIDKIAQAPSTDDIRGTTLSKMTEKKSHTTEDLDLLAEITDSLCLLDVDITNDEVKNLLQDVDKNKWLKSKIDLLWNRMHMILVNVDALQMLNSDKEARICMRLQYGSDEESANFATSIKYPTMKMVTLCQISEKPLTVKALGF